MASMENRLINLPSLVFHKIMEELVESVGLREVLPPRRVCTRFDYEILNVIVARRFSPETDGGQEPHLSEPITARLLLRRVETATKCEPPLVLAICNLIPIVHSKHLQHLEEYESSIPLAVCLAAIDYLGPTRTTKMLEVGEKTFCAPTTGVQDLLAVAAFCGSTEMVESLVLDGADVNGHSPFFGTPLPAAAIQGHYNTVLSLLKNEADVNHTDGFFQEEEKSTSLKAAMQRNRKAIVRRLLEPENHLKTSGYEYKLAVSIAAISGRKEILQILLDAASHLSLLCGSRRQVR